MKTLLLLIGLLHITTVATAQVVNPTSASFASR